MGIGCFVGEMFIGVMGYADDLVFLAPSRTAMQEDPETNASQSLLEGDALGKN